VCAGEFSSNELQSVSLSEINVTRFKICQKCFESSDPTEDYKQVKNIVNSYLSFVNAKNWLKESKEIINSLKK
jgi:peptide methionine sulfoxide reductase MsrA